MNATNPNSIYSLTPAEVRKALEIVNGGPVGRASSHKAAVDRLVRMAGAAGMTTADVVRAVKGDVQTDAPQEQQVVTQQEEVVTDEQSEQTEAEVTSEDAGAANDESILAQAEQAQAGSDDAEARIAAYEERTMAQTKTKGSKAAATGKTRPVRAAKPAREPKVIRDEHGLVPGTKVATVYEMVIRDGGATSAEIQAAANTKYIRQACDQLKKTLPGFSFKVVKDGKEYRWTGSRKATAAGRRKAQAEQATA